MKRNLNRGFTLIELLVVIAIIGILASVVLASLNTARQKGQDAAIQQQINGMRAQAEIWYDDQAPRSFNGLCAAGQVTEISTGVNNSGGTFTCRVNNNGGTNQGFIVYSPLIEDSTEYYCVDSEGSAGIGSNPGTAATTCP